MKATFTLETAIDRIVQAAVIIPAVIWILNPYVAQASMSLQTSGEATQVFEVKNLPKTNSENSDQVVPTTHQASLAYATVMANDVEYQAKLAYQQQLRDYLAQRNSPLADCVEVLTELKTSDKILSLANAESGLGRHYIKQTSNMWGVDGGKRKMGNTVCEGVISMDTFLQNYPRRSQLKYADMSFDQMNGLYKQPKAAHWELNNAKVYNALQAMKAQARQIAQTKINPPVIAVTVDAELKK